MARRIALAIAIGVITMGCGGDGDETDSAASGDDVAIGINDARDDAVVSVEGGGADGLSSDSGVPEGMTIPLYEGGQIAGSGVVDDPTLGTVASVNAVYPASKAPALVAFYNGYFEDSGDITGTESTEGGLQSWSWITDDESIKVLITVAEGETVANVSVLESLANS